MFHRKNPSDAPVASHQYDRDTGQAFVEWQEAVDKTNYADWHRQGTILLRNAPGEKPKIRARGPRNLADMAIGVLVANLSSSEEDILQHIPAHVVQNIWDYVNKNYKQICFQTYKILTKYFLREHREFHPSEPISARALKATYKVRRPAKQLALYINPLTSTSFDFIAHLLIGSSASFETHDLLSLTQLKNLGVLEIIQPKGATAQNFPRVTDAVIRHWSEEPNPFPVLRVMRIWGFDFTTMKSLQYLSKFPSLAIYDVAGRTLDWSPLDKHLDWAWDQKRNLNHDMMSLFNFLSQRWISEIGFFIVTAGELQNILMWLVDETTEGTAKIIDGHNLPKSLTNACVTSTIDATQPYSYYQGYRHHRGLRHRGFCMYWYVGRVRSDEDWISQGLHRVSQTYLLDEHRILPPRPFVSLELGNHEENPERFERYTVFTLKGFKQAHEKRKATADPKSDRDAKRPSPPNGTRKMRKKQKDFTMSDL
ncbi:hypothetical protein M426DRAFT_246696 [Hypoxylon sp. CI-4A]|nr:hypothetical protein M426DRAFT_246696 [Hypoxylon sp. CI-4A]